jgi:hypothetical protein
VTSQHRHALSLRANHGAERPIMASIEVLDICPDNKTALVSTKDRYRVVVHGGKSPGPVAELLEFEEALAYCQSYNYMNDGIKSWAEILDYKEARRREEHAFEDEETEERVEREVARRLGQRKAEKKRRKLKAAS